MTGAMYAAISGLKNHMQKLNVIGNNIANVNTYGYKSGRVVFQDSLYTSLQSGSNGTTSVGARNPSQIGYGVQISTIDLDMSTGTYTPTGVSSDCMIFGDGFFLVGDKTVAGSIDPANPESLKSLTLSRLGNIDFRADGYLTDGNGNVVYGFMNSGDGVADNGTDPEICDQLVPIRLPRMNADGDILYPQVGNGTGGNANGALEDQLTDQNGDPTSVLAIDSLTIDGKTGAITAVTKDGNEPIIIGYIAIGNVTNPSGLTHESGPYFRADAGAGDLTVSMLGGVAEELGISYVNGSMNGNTGGTADGPIGMRIGSAGATELLTGGLEMSKTDLATEIAEMITTQRGYQANTRIITVTDSMLEELVNIKR